MAGAGDAVGVGDAGLGEGEGDDGVTEGEGEGLLPPLGEDEGGEGEVAGAEHTTFWGQSHARATEL